MTEDEPKIDPSKIRVGDEVDIRVKVIGGGGVSRFEAMAAHVNTHVWFAPADIIAHHPRQLQVGDKVRSPSGALLEIVSPRRERADGRAQYTVWNGAYGYISPFAEDVESWERVQ